MQYSGTFKSFINARLWYSQDGTQLGVKVQYATYRQEPQVGRRNPHQDSYPLGCYTKSMPRVDLHLRPRFPLSEESEWLLNALADDVGEGRQVLHAKVGEMNGTMLVAADPRQFGRFSPRSVQTCRKPGLAHQNALLLA